MTLRSVPPSPQGQAADRVSPDGGQSPLEGAVPEFPVLREPVESARQEPAVADAANTPRELEGPQGSHENLV